MDNVITGLESAPAAARDGVLTIGNFDGVHLGHVRIIAAAREWAAAEGVPVVAMTMEPPPDLVLNPTHAPRRITPPEVKYRLLRQAGADFVVAARTDKHFLGLTPGAFVDEVIVGTFAPRHMVEGHDFAFGRGRSGSVETLEAVGPEKGFSVREVDPVRIQLSDGEHRVSSTLIRRCVMDGCVEDAAVCLGRSFALYGSVITGAGHGRILEFPTANLDCGDQAIPGDGVYVGRAVIGDEAYFAAVSVGKKPTLGPTNETLVEAFLIDTSGDFYGCDMELAFLSRLRDQKKFENMEQLQEQIARDVQAVRKAATDYDA